jgi:hypothetical protein
LRSAALSGLKEYAVNENMNDGTARATARRRLLRGSFAVPTVVALSSGSALAQSSSLNCFGKLPQGVESPPENVFRVQRFTYVVGGVPTQLVKASDISNLADAQGFDARRYVYGKTYINVATGLDFPIAGGAFTTDTNFVSLRFTIVGTGAAALDFKVSGLANSASALTGIGNVMTGSCWLSV